MKNKITITWTENMVCSITKTKGLVLTKAQINNFFKVLKDNPDFIRDLSENAIAYFIEELLKRQKI